MQMVLIKKGVWNFHHHTSLVTPDSALAATVHTVPSVARTGSHTQKINRSGHENKQPSIGLAYIYGALILIMLHIKNNLVRLTDWLFYR